MAEADAALSSNVDQKYNKTSSSNYSQQDDKAQSSGFPPKHLDMINRL